MLKRVTFLFVRYSMTNAKLNISFIYLSGNFLESCFLHFSLEAFSPSFFSSLLPSWR